MVCNKCGTTYPDNGTCPNCSEGNSFFKPAGSLDDSMDMSPPVYTPPAQKPQYEEIAANNAEEELPVENIPSEPVATPVVDPPVTSAENITYNAAPPQNTYTPQPSVPYTPAPAKPKYIAHIIISAIILILMLFVPMITNGGLIPDKNAISLAEIFENLDNTSDETAVMILMLLASTVLSSVLLLGSCIKKKVLCIISSIIGFVTLITVPIIRIMYVSKYVSDSDIIVRMLFDADYAMFTIAFWAVAILYIVHFIISCSTRNRK